MKHSFWRGSYERLAGVAAGGRLFTLHPLSRTVTNEWGSDELLRLEETRGPSFCLIVRRRLPCELVLIERLCFAMDDREERSELIYLLRSAMRRPAVVPVSLAQGSPDLSPLVPQSDLLSAASSNMETLDCYSAESESPLLVRRTSDTSPDHSNVEEFIVVTNGGRGADFRVEGGEATVTPSTDAKREKVRDGEKVREGGPCFHYECGSAVAAGNARLENAQPHGLIRQLDEASMAH